MINIAKEAGAMRSIMFKGIIFTLLTLNMLYIFVKTGKLKVEKCQVGYTLLVRLSTLFLKLGPLLQKSEK